MVADNLLAVSGNGSDAVTEAANYLTKYIAKQATEAKARLASNECAITEVGLKPEMLSDFFWVLVSFFGGQVYPFLWLKPLLTLLPGDHPSCRIDVKMDRRTDVQR